MKPPFSRLISFLFAGARPLLVVMGLGLFGCVKTPAPDSTDASLSECTLNTATSSACKVSTSGSIVTTTQGANITSGTNVTASTSVTANIPNGFYSGKKVTFTDSLLIGANIKSGVAIFGVTGTAPTLASNAHRTKSGTQLSAFAEASTYAGLHLPISGGYVYREVPKITLDDDGTSGNATPVDRTGWGATQCGVASGTSIETRISQCATAFSTNATWTGSAKGHAGQATWQLVSRTGDCLTGPVRNCLEVWRDNRTQLLWSSRVSDGTSWCMASGNNTIAGNPFADTETAAIICDRMPGQKTAAPAVSACYEASGDFTDTDASIGNTAGKIMNLTTDHVAWRLPTLYDYKQADVDGIRYVMPDMGANLSTATNEWTASILSTSTNRDSAWTFDAYLGGSGSSTRDTLVGARCIGR